jgi:hypothetical protein
MKIEYALERFGKHDNRHHTASRKKLAATVEDLKKRLSNKRLLAGKRLMMMAELRKAAHDLVRFRMADSPGRVDGSSRTVRAKII